MTGSTPRRASGWSRAERCTSIFGLICFGVARGDRSEEASSQGALAELSERSFGNALLVALAVGLGLYALICALGAVRGYGGKHGGESDTKDRVLDAFRAVVNAALAAVAVKIALDGSQAASGGNQQEQHITARVLDWPAASCSSARSAWRSSLRVPCSSRRR